MLIGLLKRLVGSRRAPTPAGTRATAGDADDVFAKALRLQQAGQHQEAATLCRSLLASEPHSANALNLLAAALCAKGEIAEGTACLRRVTELAPESAEARANLAAVLATSGEIDAAIGDYRRAVRLRAEFPGAWRNLTNLLKTFGRYDEAEQSCRAGLQANPDDAVLHHTLAGVLFEQGRVPEAIEEARAALECNSDMPAAHSDLARMMSYVEPESPAEVYRQLRSWAARYAAPLERAAAPHDRRPDAARRLRIGYVSPYFRKHAVTFFFETVIQHHDRKNFDIVLYADVAKPDEYSERLQGYGSHWRRTLGLTDAQLAQVVRDDAIDILVDLSGHTPGNRLLAFARRPAPVQVTANTTGMVSMNYRITDAHLDPPGSTEHLHSEKPLRLPHIYMAWRPPDIICEPGPLPALATGQLVFGSFNSCFKITPTTLLLWSRILKALPESRLMLLAFNSEIAEQRVRASFDAKGIDGARLEFVGRLGFEEYFAIRQRVDVALDTWPFHGNTTTCDSLWMGLPVVVLAGVTHFSRVGVSMLTNAGLAELIAEDEDAYVHIAVSLSSDLRRLAALREGLRERLLRAPNTDGPACAKNLEAAYRRIWESRQEDYG